MTPPPRLKLTPGRTMNFHANVRHHRDPRGTEPTMTEVLQPSHSLSERRPNRRGPRRSSSWHGREDSGPPTPFGRGEELTPRGGAGSVRVGAPGDNRVGNY